MKGIVVTPRNKVFVKDFGEPLYKAVGDVVGGYIEIVHPKYLERPYCMIVNEEGLLMDLPTNPVGCFLYGTLEHGYPIVGTAVFMKDGFRNGEPDIVGLEDGDIAALMKKFNETFNLKGEDK